MMWGSICRMGKLTRMVSVGLCEWLIHNRTPRDAYRLLRMSVSD